MSSSSICETNNHYTQLFTQFGIHARIESTNDPAAPLYQIIEDGHGSLIKLNCAKIAESDYPAHAGYHARQILLPQLHLETDRLILRRYRREDAADCFDFLSNEQDAYMDCCRTFSTMDADFYQQVALFGQRDTQYMIESKENRRVIGTVNVFADDSRAVDAMEIGYSIGHAYQRKGYAFEALSTLLDLIQNKMDLELVVAGILPENTASKGLLKKLGFREEGLRRKAVWHEGLNKPVDLFYFYRDREAK